MGEALRLGFGGLLDFEGRCTIRNFWLFFGFIIALNIFITLMLLLQPIIDVLSYYSQLFEQAGNISRAQAESQMINVMGGYYTELSKLIPVFLIVDELTIAMLAGVTVRRLHDSNLSGWWYLAPVGCYLLSEVFGIYDLMATIEAFGPNGNPAMLDKNQLQHILMGLPTYVCFGLMIWFGSRSSTPAWNRYGAPVEDY